MTLPECRSKWVNKKVNLKVFWQILHLLCKFLSFLYSCAQFIRFKVRNRSYANKITVKSTLWMWSLPYQSLKDPLSSLMSSLQTSGRLDWKDNGYFYHNLKALKYFTSQHTLIKLESLFLKFKLVKKNQAHYLTISNFHQPHHYLSIFKDVLCSYPISYCQLKQMVEKWFDE